jgi:hypothetical protein
MRLLSETVFSQRLGLTGRAIQFGSKVAPSRPSNAKKLILFGALCVVLVGSGAAFGQVPTGSIAGTVADAQGLPVSGASVVITNQGTGAQYKTTTSDLGAYSVTSLDFGVYNVEVTKEGFHTTTVAHIKLDAGTQYSVKPITLEVGAVTETVSVQAGAELVQTTNSQVTGTVEKKQIDQLPLNGRSPLNLVSLQAGVTQNGKSNTSINGQRVSFTNVTLDGINIQDNFIRANDVDFLPNLLLIDQVAEFTIINQNAGVESGQGSSQVSFVTPSGTNNWHGDGFWYQRNSALAANSWFNNARGVPKGQLILNQGGGSIGGPLVRNKLFIYGVYELYRRKQTSPQNHTVLAPNAAQGSLTYVPTCTTACPAGVTPGVPRTVKLLGTGGLRPALGIDPVIQGLIGRMSTTINNFDVGDSKSASDLRNTAGDSFNKRNNRTRDNVGTRVDYVPSSKHSIAGTFQWNRDILDRPGLDGTFGLVPVVSNSDFVKFLSSSWRYNIKPNLTNEVRFGFNLAPSIFDTSQAFGNFIIAPPVPSQGSGLSFTNPDTTFRAQGRYTNTYSWQDNASYVREDHSLTFGAQVQRIHVKQYDDAGITPSYTISATGLGPLALAGGDFNTNGGISAADLATGNSLLATLSGAVSNVSKTFNVTSRTSGFVPGANNTRNNSLNDLSFYGGDSWRIRKNLTFNYGLRWEYIGRFDEDNGLILLPVVPAGQTALSALLSNATVDFAGSGTSRPVYERNLHNFAPNIGLAWDPRGNGRMAIRAGYSIHFVNDEAIRSADNASANNPGLSSAAGVSGCCTSNSISGNAGAGLATPPSVATPTFGIPTTFQNNLTNLRSPQAGFLVDPNIATPYVQEWNLSVQRDIGWKTSLAVSYIGNKGTGLYQVIDYNQVLINPNGILADFNRARSNGFLALAATGSFNPNFNPSITGSQPLTVIPNLCLVTGQSAACPTTGPLAVGGLPLTNATVANLILTGQVGEFVNTYFSTNRSGTVQLVPNQLASVADILQAYSSSVYHSGVVELRRRFTSGLYFQANYVFSKVLTNSSGGSQTKVDPLLDNAQPRLERARADFDITHAFKGNFVYELPFGKGHKLSPSNGFLSQLVSRWNTTSIFTWQTGAPFSIFSNRGTLNRATRSSGKNTAVSALSHSDLASAIGISFSGNKVLVINPSFIGPDGRGVPQSQDQSLATCVPLTSGGFCNPGPNQVGTLQRNAFSGPPFFGWDFGLLKQFPISERKYVEYRAEFFNFLNHPVFFVGDQNINSTTFGTSTSTLSSARVIQMALRIVF